VLARPWKIPEAFWAAGGALALIALRIVSLPQAWEAVASGLDVYFFLIGMMVLSELARSEGVFDWLATHAVRAAGRSPRRLLLLIYCVGVAVTALLSNDATAVVLTPAVLAAVRAARVNPEPHLLACTMVANAASFVLPISNPANLVVYNGAIPALGSWLRIFSLPSVVAIVATYALLRAMSGARLHGVVGEEAQAPLGASGIMTLVSIGVFAVVLLTASALGADLGVPALITGLALLLAVGLRDRTAFTQVRRHVEWSVVPLVAGLFVIVEALNRAGAAGLAAQSVERLSKLPEAAGALATSLGVTAIANLMNNLPAGLIAGQSVRAAHLTGTLRDAVLIAIDLGPNLSVSGSLATILWLIALRREGIEFGFWRFLRYGLVIAPPAVALATLALFVR
jgi:arsenical pump membrane protein